MRRQDLILQLFELGAIRFGTFTLKSGLCSPIYLDLRLTISAPKLLAEIAKALYEISALEAFDLICGVPYTALPFATAVSLQQQIPMVLRRKEKKEYGTAKMIEGIFHMGQKCLILEDVITSGQSILETAQGLKEIGLLVEHAAVLIDRGQGGVQTLKSHGIEVRAVLTLFEILATLRERCLVDEVTVRNVETFVLANQLATQPRPC